MEKKLVSLEIFLIFAVIFERAYSKIPILIDFSKIHFNPFYVQHL